MDARANPTGVVDELTLSGAPEGLDALATAERLKADGGVALFVARDYQRAAAFAQAFDFFSDGIETLEFPAWDCLPYDRLSPTPAVQAQRMAALTRLAARDHADKTPLLVIATVASATQKTPPREVTEAAGFETKVGREVDTAMSGPRPCPSAASSPSGAV